MLNAEKRLIEKVEKNRIILFCVIVAVLGMGIRIVGRSFVSGDAKWFLLPWLEEIRAEGGMAALRSQTGDYNIFYQFLIALLSYLPLNGLTLYKGLSIIFDYVMAVGAGLLVCEITHKKSKSLFSVAYAVVLFWPSNVINSSVWAQCDSIYTSFVLFALLCLLSKHYKAAFAFLGVAFSCKLQAVFIVPLFMYYYITEKKYSISYFLITVLFFYIPCIPAFLYGRSLLEPIRIYLNQSSLYPKMWLNFPSFWVFVGDNYEVFGRIAILMTIFVLGCGLMYLMEKRITLCDPVWFIQAAVWTVWSCVLFLPAMHERYGYLLAALLIVLAFVDKKYAVFAAVVEIITLLTYGHYLTGSKINICVLSAVYFAAYMAYCCLICGWKKRNINDAAERRNSN